MATVKMIPDGSCYGVPYSKSGREILCLNNFQGDDVEEVYLRPLDETDVPFISGKYDQYTAYFRLQP